MTNCFDDVGSFHMKFGLPTSYDTAPAMMTPEEEPPGPSSLEDAADALADLVYVALGTAHLMGLPFNAVWDEVQRANMMKERATGADDPRSKRGHGFDVVKPEGFRPPNHTGIIALAGIADPRERNKIVNVARSVCEGHGESPCADCLDRAVRFWRGEL
jgi:hypothetical protein